jgi:hypothetical protein
MRVRAIARLGFAAGARSISVFNRSSSSAFHQLSLTSTGAPASGTSAATSSFCACGTMPPLLAQPASIITAAQVVASNSVIGVMNRRVGFMVLLLVAHSTLKTSGATKKSGANKALLAKPQQSRCAPPFGVALIADLVQLDSPLVNPHWSRQSVEVGAKRGKFVIRIRARVPIFDMSTTGHEGFQMSSTGKPEGMVDGHARKTLRL